MSIWVETLYNYLGYALLINRKKIAHREDFNVVILNAEVSTVPAGS
jgi:hypothetical protein